MSSSSDVPGGVFPTNNSRLIFSWGSLLGAIGGTLLGYKGRPFAPFYSNKCGKIAKLESSIESR